MNAFVQQMAFQVLSLRMDLRKPEFIGHAFAYSAAARLPERARGIVLKMARKHADKKAFQNLCQNL